MGWLFLGLAPGAAAAESLKIELKETAGIRRFGYPVAIKLPESLSAADGHFRLRDGEKPVSAQFRQEKSDNGAGPWWLDFNVSMMPNQRQTFVLEYGANVAAAAESPGLTLEQTPEGFIVRNRTYIAWALGRKLSDLLRSVEAGDLQHLRREGMSLSIEGPDETHLEMDAEAIRTRVIRAGPLAIAIRYEFAVANGPLAGLKSAVDLTFPTSKSWVQVDWQIDDPRKAVRSVHARIAQNLNAPTAAIPTLVDFGASSLVYMSLSPRMIGKLQAKSAGPQSSGSLPQSWEVLRGAKNRLEPFVARPAEAASADAEGWAHIMDRDRCLALAVDEFGDNCADSIETTAEGDVTIARKFAGEEAGQAKMKSCRFWLHFVGFPPHLTAATSPQSMLTPLSVRLSEP